MVRTWAEGALCTAVETGRHPSPWMDQRVSKLGPSCDLPVRGWVSDTCYHGNKLENILLRKARCKSLMFYDSIYVNYPELAKL